MHAIIIIMCPINVNFKQLSSQENKIRFTKKIILFYGDNASQYKMLTRRGFNILFLYKSSEIVTNSMQIVI
jgi:hypothetical protein